MGFEDFKDYDWILMVEYDEAEVMGPIFDLGIRILMVFVLLLLIIVAVGYYISRSITQPLKALQSGVNIIGSGDLDHRIQLSSQDEIGDLGKDFNELTLNLKQVNRTVQEKQDQIEAENWLKTGQAELNHQIRGEQDPEALSQAILNFLVPFLESQTGALYLHSGPQKLALAAGYAFPKNREDLSRISFGEGFIGQCALEGRPLHLTDIPEAFLTVDVGHVNMVPRSFMALPFFFEGELKGVLFLGALNPFTDMQQRFLAGVLDTIAIVIHAGQSRLRLKELLEKTQRQSEELQSQQEELRASNEELEEQTEALKSSEANLKAKQGELKLINEALQTQQEELRQSNEELEENTKSLERKQVEVEQQNRDLETAGRQLEEKARDLETASRYKSEFLANMSHELRTPLNSLLIFAQLLYENKDQNLSAKQVKFARDIHSSGTELLTLINDILDLSKIEAGKMDLIPENISVANISRYLQHSFQPLVEKKKLSLNIRLDRDVPDTIHTDSQKLNQILKNLMSNAVKFTQKGGIDVRIFRPAAIPDTVNMVPGQTLAISISDSGIGIPVEKQKLIFEAFQQVDGSTSRQYGGTGLGLSISRELVKLLQCEILLESSEGEGSTFTLYLPLHIENIQTGVTTALQPPAQNEGHPTVPIPVMALRIPGRAASPASTVLTEETEKPGFEGDDSDNLLPDEKSILIIDDDVKFARILLDLAREKGFKGLVAVDGAKGLAVAEKRLPSAIILDINLPGMDGWTVMEQLKSHPRTRAIPVHFISVLDKKMIGLKIGAIGFLTKPVNREKLGQAFDKIENTITKTIQQLLIVEDDETTRNSLSDLLGEKKDLQIHLAATAGEALTILQSNAIDLMILDLRLPDMSGFELLSRIEKESSSSLPPVIVHTGRDITRREEIELRKYAESIIVKGVNSGTRLLDEVTLFLHRVEADLPAELQNTFRMIHDQETALKDREILLVDDDMRNVYALMAVLESRGLKVHAAANGQEALDRLIEIPGIDLVLMDIMMPVMDGYEAIGKIRQQAAWAKLPIIALTAKAMKGDREKCIDAGANDYLAKPVDPEKLFSLLRVWLYS